MMPLSATRILLAVLLELLTVSVACAHAMLDHAVPRVGSVVHAAPTQVQLWFSERIEPAFSTIEVRNAAGERVDSGNPQVDPNDPDVLQVSLKPLPPGTYKVIWRVVSVDTHVTNGDFKFVVQPG